MKSLLLTLSVVAVAGPWAARSSAAAPKAPKQGLVAAWSMDEKKGDVVKDSSGHGHHGTLRGAKRAPGKFGGAIECGQDALVEVPHAAALDNFPQGITVSAWVNRADDATWNTVISREVKAGTSEYFGLAVVKNRALFSIDPDGAHYQNVRSDEPVPVGEWVHLAGTYDNAVFKLYVNGRMVKSAQGSVPFSFGDQNPILIGGNTNSQGKTWLDCFHGLLDEVRLYNRPLTDADIAQLASDGVRASAIPAAPAVAAARPAGPGPGDVFREYSWTTAKFHVFSLNEKPFELPADVDLTHAVRAEIEMEIANEHMGFEGMGVRLNGNHWYPIEFPASSPRNPSPALWFHHWYPVIPVALADLKSGRANTFELRVPAECFDGKIHPNGKQPLVPWCPVYGVTLRVYYDPGRKPHPEGRIVSPAANSKVGLSVDLKASAKSKSSTIRQIDFIGRYEDVNYEGDGVYDRWHHHLFKGRITNHLGSVTTAGESVKWDTSWVPDQPGPMEIAARITDESGLIYVTRPVTGLKLVRPGLSVELCKPYDVPRSFTGCQYGEWVVPGVRTQKFDVKGDLSKVLDARYVIASWGNLKECHGYTVNGVTMANLPAGTDYYYNLSTPVLQPLSALKAGENTFSTVIGPGRMPDIYMPGVQVLVRYRTQ